MSKDSYFGELEKIDEQDMVELNEFLKEIKEVRLISAMSS